jgi:hypothetical protein
MLAVKTNPQRNNGKGRANTDVGKGNRYNA